MKKHNVNNREGREMEDVEREREKGQERRSVHQIQGNARGGRVERRRRKGRASRKTLGFARSGLVAAVASERVREWRREPPQSRRTALSSTKALRDTLLHSLTVFSLDSFFFIRPFASFLPSFLSPSLKFHLLFDRSSYASLSLNS